MVIEPIPPEPVLWVVAGVLAAGVGVVLAILLTVVIVRHYENQSGVHGN